MKKPLLSVKNLQVHFPVKKGILFKKTIGHIHAVDGVSFDIYEGEVLGVVGESGCGKTTTARAIARLVKAVAGEVIWDGKNILALEKNDLLAVRQYIQMIFQDPYSSLDPRMTAEAIISEPLDIFSQRGILQLSKAEMRARVDDLMDLVGLLPGMKNRYPHEFSGGQRQRIGIARALALNPKLLLADEPVSALDVSIQAQVINLLQDLQKKLNLTFLIIAHDLAIVRYITNRVAVMYLGHIVEEAPTEKLFTNPIHPYTKALLSAIPIPDPIAEKKRNRIILSGDVPSPEIRHKGCVFYARCPVRMDKCKTSSPALVEIKKKHRSACFLHSEEKATIPQ